MKFVVTTMLLSLAPCLHAQTGPKPPPGQEKEPNGTRAQANPLAVGRGVAGAMSRADIDSFRFEVKGKGRLLTLRLAIDAGATGKMYVNRRYGPRWYTEHKYVFGKGTRPYVESALYPPGEYVVQLWCSSPTPLAYEFTADDYSEKPFGGAAHEQILDRVDKGIERGVAAIVREDAKAGRAWRSRARYQRLWNPAFTGLMLMALLARKKTSPQIAGRVIAYAEELRRGFSPLPRRRGKGSGALYVLGYAHGQTYNTAIACMALSEAYEALGKDAFSGESLMSRKVLDRTRKELLAVLKPLVSGLILAQNSERKYTGPVPAGSHYFGGWRYTSYSTDADVSVSAWVVLALATAHLAGVEVPHLEPALRASGAFFKRCFNQQHQVFVYSPGSRTYGCLNTAAAGFSLAIFRHHDDLYRAAHDYVWRFPPRWNRVEVGPYYPLYYSYNASRLVQLAAPDREWRRRFNARLAEEYLRRQDADGSWFCDTKRTHNRKDDLGRGFDTAMVVLILQFLSRHKPIYLQFARKLLAVKAPAKPVRLILVSGGKKVEKNATVAFKAVAVFSDGSRREIGSEGDWKAADPSVVRPVSGKPGAFVGLTPGKTTVRCAWQGLSAEEALEVARPRLERIRLVLPRRPLEIGEELRLEAIGLFSDSSRMPIKGTWRISDDQVATLGADGLLVAVGPGEAVIHFERDGVVVSGKIRVLPPGSGHLRLASRLEPGRLLPSVLLEIVIDCSASMNRQIAGEKNRKRIEIARRAFKHIVGKLPDRVRLAIRLFGHRSVWWKNDCKDTELVRGFRQLDRKRIHALIDRIVPRGMTPLAFSLSRLEADFRRKKGKKLVILLSDGDDSCKGKPAEEILELKKKGFEFNVHVIGFAVTKEHRRAVRQLRAVARKGEGTFVFASDLRTLVQALDRSFVPFYRLERDGKRVARARLGERVKLLAGRYQLVLETEVPVTTAVVVKKGSDLGLEVVDAGGNLAIR